MFRAARRYVVMMENWKKHEFVRDIQALHAQGRIPWPQVHLYLRRVPEMNNRPHLLIASAVMLSYEALHSDDTLVKMMDLQ